MCSRPGRRKRAFPWLRPWGTRGRLAGPWCGAACVPLGQLGLPGGLLLQYMVMRGLEVFALFAAVCCGLSGGSLVRARPRSAASSSWHAWAERGRFLGPESHRGCADRFAAQGPTAGPAPMPARQHGCAPARPASQRRGRHHTERLRHVCSTPGLLNPAVGAGGATVSGTAGYAARHSSAAACQQAPDVPAATPRAGVIYRIRLASKTRCLAQGEWGCFSR